MRLFSTTWYQTTFCTFWLNQNGRTRMYITVNTSFNTYMYYSYTTQRQWASYQIRKIAGCACAGNAGNVLPRRRFQRKPLVGDPGMHHGTCVTHVPWCMSGSLICGDGENVPGIPGACAPATLRIWQEAHGSLIPRNFTVRSIVFQVNIKENIMDEFPLQRASDMKSPSQRASNGGKVIISWCVYEIPNQPFNDSNVGLQLWNNQ